MAALFRRAPSLICYWKGGELVLENYLTGKRVTGDPLVFTLLNFFGEWKPIEDLFAHAPDYGRGSLRKAVAELVSYSLLERTRRAYGDPLNSWEEWNPAAGFFHFSTKDVPISTGPGAERRFLRMRAQKAPMPAPGKHYPRARKYALPAITKHGEIPQVLLSRRTWREFSSRALSVSDLSTLLGLTWGVQTWIDFPYGRQALKTSPSGGARHPVEVYVVTSRVEGLPRGVFHYAADRHCLEFLRPGCDARRLTSLLAGQKYFSGAAAIFFMTAVFARTQWKYPSPRAYRVVQLDAGHLCQTFCLVATWLGLAPFSTAAFTDTLIEKTLGIDGIDESVIYAAGVGHRPRGKAGSSPRSE